MEIPCLCGCGKAGVEGSSRQDRVTSPRGRQTLQHWGLRPGRDRCHIKPSGHSTALGTGVVPFHRAVAHGDSAPSRPAPAPASGCARAVRTGDSGHHHQPGGGQCSCPLCRRHAAPWDEVVHIWVTPPTPSPTPGLPSTALRAQGKGGNGCEWRKGISKRRFSPPPGLPCHQLPGAREDLSPDSGRAERAG